MLYAHLHLSKPDVFKRLSGVSFETFSLMCDVLTQHLPSRGRKARLTLEDRLLMVLSYWREYRTLAHIGMTYGVSEACVCRTVKHFESILLKDKRFHLPGKKALHQSDTIFEVVLVDVTECPCDRPKKNSDGSTRARKSGILKKHRL